MNWTNHLKDVRMWRNEMKETFSEAKENSYVQVWIETYMHGEMVRKCWRGNALWKAHTNERSKSNGKPWKGRVILIKKLIGTLRNVMFVCVFDCCKKFRENSVMRKKRNRRASKLTWWMRFCKRNSKLKRWNMLVREPFPEWNYCTAMHAQRVKWFIVRAFPQSPHAWSAPTYSMLHSFHNVPALLTSDYHAIIYYYFSSVFLPR